MADGIIIALITGGMAVISNIIVVVFNNTKTLYRIAQLEKKQEEHNNFIKRMYALEAQVGDMKNDITKIENRLP